MGSWHGGNRMKLLVNGNTGNFRWVFNVGLQGDGAFLSLRTPSGFSIEVPSLPVGLVCRNVQWAAAGQPRDARAQAGGALRTHRLQLARSRCHIRQWGSLLRFGPAPALLEPPPCSQGAVTPSLLPFCGC